MANAARVQRRSATPPFSVGFIRQHPVLAFYVLAFAISWVGILLLVGAPGIELGSPEFLLAAAPWFAGPSLASVLLTGVVSGRAGYRDLLARLVRWRVSRRWYAAALFTAPLVSVAVSFALSPASADFLPNILRPGDRIALLLMAFAYALVGGGFLEELGWTGFAVPHLRLRHGLLWTGIMVGALWGAYHFTIIYWPGTPSGPLAVSVFLAQLFAWMPPFRVLMVWVYDHTKSLLLAMLMHASATASMFILQPMTITGLPLLVYILGLAAAFWALVVVVTRLGHATHGEGD